MSSGESERNGSWAVLGAAPDWRVVGRSGVSAWFDAPRVSVGADLVRRIAELVTAGPSGDVSSVDLRGTGLRLRIAGDGGWTRVDLDLAQRISAAARDLGLTADPSVLQELGWWIDTLDQPSLEGFWKPLLRYDATAGAGLLDPLRRDPRVWFQRGEPRPLRNRIHVDVSVPRAQAYERLVELVPGADPETAFAGGWSLLADADGNEVDLVPADPPDWPGTEDWRLAFGGLAFYPTPGFGRSAALATRVAEIADRAGLALLIDLRPDGVMIDTGKDRWEDDRFPAVARDVQTAARALGLVADPSRIRFVQVGIDALDVPRVREFWRAVLGYENDPREGVSDITDPRRLDHPMIFQQLDAADVGRHRQRNRIHLDLHVPHDHLQARRERALAAGGRLVGGASGTIADPEGNEVTIEAQLSDAEGGAPGRR